MRCSEARRVADAKNNQKGVRNLFLVFLLTGGSCRGMGRALRTALGGLVYHVLNRGNGRMQIFDKDSDYDAFENVIAQACERVPMRILSYCVMPNHWHMVLWPYQDGELSKFVNWLTLTHTQRLTCDSTPRAP